MSRWLDAVREQPGAGTKPTEPTEPNPEAKATGDATTAEGVSSVSSVSSEGEGVPPRGPTPNRSAFPHGFACNRFTDHPRTWSGRVVSLDQWDRLSEWERHGPAGRVWCGQCRCWHMPGACAA